MNNIHVGKTTRSEMHHLLGAPTSPQTAAGTRTEVWEYDLINDQMPTIEVNYRVKRSVPKETHKVVAKTQRNLPEDETPEQCAPGTPTKNGK